MFEPDGDIRLQLIRLYRGWTRREMLKAWASCLRSGRFKRGASWLHDPTVEVGAVSFRHQGLFCPYGVLCYALEMPQRVFNTPSGLRTGFADFESIDFHTREIPPELHKFLVPSGKPSMTPNYERVARSTMMMSRIATETEHSIKEILHMQPTLGVLCDLGLSFNAAAVILDNNLYYPFAEHVRPAQTDQPGKIYDHPGPTKRA